MTDLVTTISDERLAKVKAIANIVALRMDMGSTPEAIAEHILSSLEASPAPVSERDDLIDYLFQDDQHNRLVPRIVDIAYNAFMLAKQPNEEDEGPSDWFTDTKPKVDKMIAEVRTALKGGSNEYGIVQEGVTYLDGFGLPHGPMTVPAVHHPAWPFEDQYGRRYGKSGIPAIGSGNPKARLVLTKGGSNG